MSDLILTNAVSSSDPVTEVLLLISIFTVPFVMVMVTGLLLMLMTLPDTVTVCSRADSLILVVTLLLLAALKATPISWMNVELFMSAWLSSGCGRENLAFT